MFDAYVKITYYSLAGSETMPYGVYQIDHSSATVSSDLLALVQALNDAKNQLGINEPELSLTDSPPQLLIRAFFKDEDGIDALERRILMFIHKEGFHLHPRI